MKSNPYVYPYIPFADLSIKEIQQNFKGEKKISWQELKDVVLSIGNPVPEISGENITEKILSIFKDENYRFGPLDYIEGNQEAWLDKLSYFVDNNKPIQFTILGFPFKVPVPLKTDRNLPDMGEVLILNRLNHICQLIQKEYQPGAKITVFTEGLFSDFVGISKKEAQDYYDFLNEISTQLSFNLNINLISLSEMTNQINFNQLYELKVAQLKKLYDNKDKQFLAKYNGTLESLKKIVATRNFSEKILMDVYNDKLDDQDVLPEVIKVRQDIKERAHQAVFSYHSYLLVRDDLDYIQKLVPNSLALSVSPKSNRLGIIPVNKECQRLPYHAVPVLNKNFTLEYLIDIKRNKNEYTPVFLTGDKDTKPFYYITYEK